MSACDLRVNGQTLQTSAEGEETLLTVLRDRLFLCGTKRGCNQGVCGACSVLVDGRSVRACLKLALDCEDAEITTIEGLEAQPAGRALQQAFAGKGAVQCGFCIPGMLVSAVDLVTHQPGASIDDIRAGLSGNLCRCSGYRKIVEAVHQVVADAAAGRHV
jgi:aerobic-type carbon monoxide dehydrogenase small subunit (CoxS/CutS family)